MRHEYKRLQEYIKNKEPFYTHAHFSMFEYDNDSDLVYDKKDDDFFFVDTKERDDTFSPVMRSFHRIDGPAHITPDNIYWYLDDSFYDFNEWIDTTPLACQEKVKLRLKYGHQL